MYPKRFIQYLNLPQIPQHLIDELPQSMQDYDHKVVYKSYRWTDDLNQEIDQWCKQHICPDMYFAFQFMEGDLEPHQDRGTLTKINYLISTGGADVITRFHEEDQVVAEYRIEPQRWHLLKADTVHSVSGVEPGLLRWSVTGRVFGQ